MYQQPNWSALAHSTSACPKCGGEQIEAKVPRYGDATAHLMPADSGIIGLHWSGLSAMVCRTCGFVEFYAEKPEELEGQR